MPRISALRRRFRDKTFFAIILATLLFAVSFLLLYRFYGVGRVIGETPWYVPTTHVITAFIAAAIAFLSLGRARLLGDGTAYRIGSGFASYAVLSVFYILSWPGLLSGGRGIIADLPGTSGWIVVLELGALGVPLLSAALLPAANRDRGMGKPRSFIPLVLWLASVGLAAVLTVMFERVLPPLADNEGNLSPLLLAFDRLFLLLFSGGAVLSTRAYLRSGDSLLGYTALAQVTVVFVVLTALIGAKRYDVWYYVSRIVLVAGFGTVFFGLLGGYFELFRREHGAREDAERGRRLLESLMENLPIGITVADAPDARIRMVSRYGEELLGGNHAELSAGEVAAKWRVFHTDGRTPMADDDLPLLRAIRRGEVVRNVEVVQENSRGKRLTLLCNAAPLRGTAGDVSGAIVVWQDITELKHLEAVLRESGERFHRIADSMPHLVWTAQPDGTVDYYNDRWSEYDGIHPNADGSWSWHLVLHPEDLETTVDAWNRAVGTGSTYEAEHRVRMRNGNFCWHYSKGVPIRDENGSIVKWYGSATNIQRMKDAEEEVRRSEEHYRRALEDSGLVAARVDSDLRYRWIYNPHADFDPNTVIGKRDDELTSPEDAAGIMSLKREVLETGKSVRREISFNLSDGTHWYSMHGEPLYDSGGKVSGLTTVSRDITEQKRAGEALRRSEARWNAAIETLSVGAIIATEGEQVVYWNPAARDMHGFTYEGEGIEPLERTSVTFQLWTPDKEHLLELDEWPMRRIKRGEPVKNLHLWLRRPDQGWEKYVSYSGKMVDTPGGERLIFLSVYDLTEQRTAETMLAQAKEQAEAANGAKSEFLAHMSHELRTPIGGIIGMTDVLASRIEDDERRGMLSLIRESAETLLSIIGDILDLSRIESGEVSMEPVDFDTGSMIDSVVNLFRMPAGTKGLELALDVAEDIPEFIRADREKIAQILRNLISNAVKYTNRGSVRISVDAPVRSPGKAMLRFRVRDTGAGIPKENFELIFKSFVRLRNSVTIRNAEGTGLGLTISRRLADFLGGSIEVESTLGHGSMFTFRVEVEELPASPAKAQGRYSFGLTSLPPLRILLVEDNRINQMFLQMMLTESGHAVTVAENGRQVVDLLETSGNEDFDLVLMDIQMPEMDGMEATIKIRSLPGRASKIPIIALTAFAMKGDEEKFLAAGMNGYLTKPVDWAEFSRVIRALRE